MENDYISSIRQTTGFLNSSWRLPLWSKAMWFESTTSWDREPRAWKEIWDAHRWNQLLQGPESLSSLVHLEWFKFGKWAGILLGWGRETMGSVQDFLSLASPCILGRLPTGKSDIWTWSATEGAEKKSSVWNGLHTSGGRGHNTCHYHIGRNCRWSNFHVCAWRREAQRHLTALSVLPF